MHLFHLGSTIGRFYSKDCQKIEWIGQHDFTNKIMIEFICDENDTSLCWLAVLNGAKKVYVYAPTEKAKDQSEYAKFICTPTIGHRRISIIDDVHILPLDIDIVIDPPSDWIVPKGTEVIQYPTKKSGIVTVSSYLNLLDFNKEEKLDTLSENSIVVTDDVTKAIIAVYKGVKLVQLQVNGNYQSVHNFILYYVPPILLTKIKIVRSH